jgi:hypothetical protein
LISGIKKKISSAVPEAKKSSPLKATSANPDSAPEKTPGSLERMAAPPAAWWLKKKNLSGKKMGKRWEKTGSQRERTAKPSRIQREMSAK